MDLSKLDLSKVEIKEAPKKEFGPLPEGKYEVNVAEATRIIDDKNRVVYKLRLRIAEGPESNRLIFEDIRFDVNNEQSVRISAERVKQFLMSVKVDVTTTFTLADLDALVAREALLGKSLVVGTKNSTVGDKIFTNVRYFAASKRADQAVAPTAPPGGTVTLPGMPSV